MSRLLCLSGVLVAHCLGRTLGASPVGTSANVQDRADGSTDELKEDQWPTIATKRQLSEKPPTVMKSSDALAHSNRKGSGACKCPNGKSSCPGYVCTYKCDKGYEAVGQHVFRTKIDGVVGNGFSGGRCVRSCPGVQECSKDQVPIRYRDGAYQASGECFKTACIDAVPKCKGKKCSAEDAGLMAIARGNWALWQMARSEISGLYVDHISLTDMTPAWKQGKADVTGCGLIMECIAHAAGWQTTQDAQKRVRQTLRALLNKIEGVHIVRSTHGNFFPGVFDTSTGKTKNGEGGGNVVATGLLFGGVLFAKTYFQRVAPQVKDTQRIVDDATRLFKSIQWDKMMCDSKKKTIDIHNGDGATWDVTADGSCNNVNKIQGGKLQFNEGYVAHWLGHQWACDVQKTSSCTNMERMWKAAQEAKKKTIKWTNPESGFSTDLLSKWGSYVVQLPFYMAFPFNSDSDFKQLFKNSWSAEQDRYAHAPYYSPESYGLGAGPTAQWCAGTGYEADRIHVSSPCLTYTPEGTVGYLSTFDKGVKHSVLKMLEEGEGVTLVRDPKTKNDYPFLSRRMFADPDWRPYAVTMIDVSGELFGLGAYFLGKQFFVDNTKYFQHFNWQPETQLNEVNEAEPSASLYVASGVPEYAVFLTLFGVISGLVAQLLLRLHRARGQVDQSHGSAESQVPGIDIGATVQSVRELGVDQGEPEAPLLG